MLRAVGNFRGPLLCQQERTIDHWGLSIEAPPLERKLVAIVAADVEGHSSLMSIDEEGPLATLSDHRTIADALIAQHGGRICGTAGVLAEFGSVFAARQTPQSDEGSCRGTKGRPARCS